MKRSHPTPHMPALCVCSLLLLALLPGCVTSGGNASNAVGESAAREAIDVAQKAIKDGAREEIVPQLKDVIANFPGTTGAAEAYYFLGLVYSETGKYRDAYAAFREYVTLAPQGRFAASSSEYGMMLSREIKIENLRAKLAAEPDSVALQWELADLLWQRGSFDEAGSLYQTIVAKRPEYAQDATFKSRMEIQPDGQYIVLTPAELVRRQNEAQPIVVINVNTFRTGQINQDYYRLGFVNGVRIRQGDRQYAVTGQALNRSENPAYGVQVYVTIYGQGNLVLDTTTVNIGRLNAGESRPFSVEFNTFESIDDILRCECVGTFQR